MTSIRGGLLYPVFRRFEFRGKRRLRNLLGPPTKGRAEITISSARFQIDLAESMQRDVFYGLCDSFDRRLLARFLQAGGDLIDVGAHMGLYSVTLGLALHGHGRVLAFEPNDRSADQLVANLMLNRCDNVIVVRRAASDERGHAALRIPTRGDAAWSSLTADGFDHELVTIELTRVDDEVDTHSLRPRAVKIDVEGHELAVLDGMEHTLESRPAVLCEVSGATTAVEVQRRLEALGYASFRVFPTRLAPLAHALSPGLFNALFVPGERLSELGRFRRTRGRA
jgi:FkbM family methyltransferase